MMGILRKEISSMNYEQSKRFDLEKKEILTYYTSTLKPFLIPGIITFMTLLLILLATLLGMSMINPDFKWYESLDCYGIRLCISYNTVNICISKYVV